MAKSQKGTSLVFHELDLSGPLMMPPIRNPLSEVRWLGFLWADAYANPFHDLLYALSRSYRPAVETKRPGIRNVDFGTDGFSVTMEGTTLAAHPYEALSLCKLDYTTIYQEQGLYSQQYAYGGYTKFSYRVNEDVRVINLRMSQGGFKKLVTMLYQHRVKFREFSNGQRTFKLNSNIPYRRVQQLKAEYGIDW